MTDRAQWREVADEMAATLGDRRVELGRYYSYWFDSTPRRALYHMSYYKFAAKLIGRDRRVLDIGCSEGLGTWLLAKECGFARGMDLDSEALEVAGRNWRDESIEFVLGDFLEISDGLRKDFDAATSFDVIEHIRPDNADRFLRGIADSVQDSGLAIIGTPSAEGQRYASEISKRGHVNVYSGDRLEAAVAEHFHHVFLFGANDEVVHTGYRPMCHYLIAVGARPRRPSGSRDRG